MSPDPIATVWQTVKDFFAEERVVLRHPWSFPERLGLGPANLFGKGTAFVVLASAVTYLLCIPIFLRHEIEVSKGVMLLTNITEVYVYGFVLHFMLKLMGSRGVSLKETMGLYGYQMGILLVVSILLMYLSLMAYKQLMKDFIASLAPPLDLPIAGIFNFEAMTLIVTAWLAAASDVDFWKEHVLNPSHQA